MSEFEWNGIDADSVIVPQIQQTAVYLNQSNDIVIRQKNILEDQDDHYIVIPKIFLAKFLEKIAELQKEMT